MAAVPSSHEAQFSAADDDKSTTAVDPGPPASAMGQVILGAAAHNNVDSSLPAAETSSSPSPPRALPSTATSTPTTALSCRSSVGSAHTAASSNPGSWKEPPPFLAGPSTTLLQRPESAPMLSSHSLWEGFRKKEVSPPVSRPGEASCGRRRLFLAALIIQLGLRQLTALREQKAIADDGSVLLAAFRNDLTSFACEACSTPMGLRAVDVVARMKSSMTKRGEPFSPETSTGNSAQVPPKPWILIHRVLETVTPRVPCPRCSIFSCFGCGIFGSREAKHPGYSAQLEWCCDEGRLFLVWALCCGIDEQAIAQTQTATTPTISGPRRAANRASSTGTAPSSNSTPSAATNALPPPPVGGSTFSLSLAVPSGVGYGGTNWDLRGLPQKLGLSTKPLSAREGVEGLYKRYFAALAGLLSHQASARFRDRWSWLELASHLIRRSSLLPVAAELLRNACVEDMAQHNGQYMALLEFLGTMAESEATARVLTDPMTLYPPWAQAPVVALVDPRQGAGSQHFEESDGIAALVIGNRSMYASTIKHATTYKDDFSSADDGKMLTACRQYLALADNLGPRGWAVVVDTASGRGSKAKAARQARQESWSAWQKEHCLVDLPDDELLKSFHFAAAAATSFSAPVRGRMKRLITDLAALRTSLPEGIFVRHGSSRIDIMKVLIVGPRSTPYEGGLWEFSLYCPPDFPQSPPQMRNHTTGGGRIRFNPNLYHDGSGMCQRRTTLPPGPDRKSRRANHARAVCLSILNTWRQGQTWQPHQSTLLQVLVSIQGMVFCEEPWYNEPGREGKRDNAASQRENAALQGSTIEFAMLPWLAKLPVGESSARPAARVGDTDMYVWSDVVRRHFAANGKTILETIKGWSNKRKLDELTKALEKHGFLA